MEKHENCELPGRLEFGASHVRDPIKLLQCSLARPHSSDLGRPVSTGQAGNPPITQHNVTARTCQCLCHVFFKAILPGQLPVPT